MPLTTIITGQIRIVNRVFIGTSVRTSLWVLIAGVWNDSGKWLDNELWEDGVY